MNYRFGDTFTIDLDPSERTHPAEEKTATAAQPPTPARQAVPPLADVVNAYWRAELRRRADRGFAS